MNINVFYQRYPNAPQPNGRPMTHSERDAWLSAHQREPLFPKCDYRLHLSPHPYQTGAIAYKIVDHATRAPIRDLKLHDVLRGAMDVLFQNQFIYGRPLNQQTMMMIRQILIEDISLMPEHVGNPDSVFAGMRDVIYDERIPEWDREFLSLQDGTYVT